MLAAMEPERRKRLFFRIRVAVLLFVLFVVVLYAIRDIRSRGARKDWDHTLDVAIVLLRDGNVDPAALESVRERAPALADRLNAEMRRYRTVGPPPFRFHVKGPIDGVRPPPAAAGDGVVDLAKGSAALATWLGEVDPRAGVVPDHYDTRIYVTVRPGDPRSRSMFEGMSEENGRVGLVSVELDATMVDTTLFVVAHELMHTLGATDRYDASGHTLIPAGLPEPDRSPLYPQRFAEVMARNRVVAAGREVVPETIGELAVGSDTAKEIGWR